MELRPQSGLPEKIKRGQEYFWGIYHCHPACSGYFSDTVSALSNFGYELQNSENRHSLETILIKVVYQSDGQIDHPVSYAFTVGDGTWKLEVTPKTGWRNNTLLIIISGMFLTISLLLSVLTRVWLIAKRTQEQI